MTIKKLLLKQGIFLLCFLCTGCWDVEEVNRRALPNTLYYDLGQEKKIQMGMDMHVPGTLLPPVNTMEQQFNKNHGFLFAEGQSSVEAWSKLQALTSRTIFFGQLRAVILTERFARQNMVNSLDFLGRVPFVSSETIMLVTKDDPQEIIDLKNKSNFIPGNYISQYFQSPYKEMLAKNAALWEFFSHIDNKTADPHLPLISISQGNYIIAGTALFAGPSMAGELDQQETYLFTLLHGGNTGFVTIPLDDGKLVTFIQMQGDSKIEPSYSNGILTYKMDVKVNAMLAEADPYPGNLTLQDKRNMEQKAQEYLQQEILRLHSKLQALKTDPLGCGEKFRSKYPELWGKLDWSTVYPTAQFQVQVKFKVKKSGLFR